MRQALQDFAKSLAWNISDAAAVKVPVEIITPAATNTRNKPLLYGLNGGTFPLRVSFDSTVHTDPELLKPLEQRLLDMKLAINRDVAVLIEENTSWHGLSVTGSVKGSFDDALQLRFPLHISRLGGHDTPSAARLPWDSGPATLPLALDDAQRRPTACPGSRRQPRWPRFLARLAKHPVDTDTRAHQSSRNFPKLRTIATSSFLPWEVRRVAPDARRSSRRSRTSSFCIPTTAPSCEALWLRRAIPSSLAHRNCFRQANHASRSNRKGSFNRWPQRDASTRSCFSCDGASGFGAARITNQAAR